MKYTGRITLSIFVIATTIGWITYYYFETGSFHWEEIIFNIPFLVLSWYLGKQHDLATFYAHYDILTHVYNRYYLGKIIPKTLRKLKKVSSSMTVFIIDIDNFKEINDEHGHQKGDLVLQLLASTLKEDISKANIIGRLGGDEFIVGIPNGNIHSSESVINRWNNQIKDIEKKTGVSITVSIGTSSFPVDGDNLDDLYHKADIEMYYNKKYNKQATFQT